MGGWGVSRLARIGFPFSLFHAQYLKKGRYFPVIFFLSFCAKLRSVGMHESVQSLGIGRVCIKKVMELYLGKLYPDYVVLCGASHPRALKFWTQKLDFVQYLKWPYGLSLIENALSYSGGLKTELYVRFWKRWFWTYEECVWHPNEKEKIKLCGKLEECVGEYGKKRMENRIFWKKVGVGLGLLGVGGVVFGYFGGWKYAKEWWSGGEKA